MLVVGTRLTFSICRCFCSDGTVVSRVACPDDGGGGQAASEVTANEASWSTDDGAPGKSLRVVVKNRSPRLSLWSSAVLDNKSMSGRTTHRCRRNRSHAALDAASTATLTVDLWCQLLHSIDAKERKPTSRVVSPVVDGNVEPLLHNYRDQELCWEVRIRVALHVTFCIESLNGWWTSVNWYILSLPVFAVPTENK